MSLSAAERQELAKQLRERAVALRKEMESKLDEATDEARDAGARGDSGDRSFAAAESEVDAGEAQRDQSELGAIERTLARIEEGSYGVCIECGADIPIERLRAQPLASRCTKCQSDREAREGRFR
ncbi:MAG: TraR/DksA C4-type zinc finger protein [Gemmatimonadales bacterium]|nr:TraR/DksA C4-type zinc finger protein [Gemmatimonadales bacterium]